MEVRQLHLDAGLDIKGGEQIASHWAPIRRERLRIQGSLRRLQRPYVDLKAVAHTTEDVWLRVWEPLLERGKANRKAAPFEAEVKSAELQHGGNLKGLVGLYFRSGRNTTYLARKLKMTIAGRDHAVVAHRPMNIVWEDLIWFSTADLRGQAGNVRYGLIAGALDKS